MIETGLQKEILDAISTLPKAKQLDVLTFARVLASNGSFISGKDLLKFNAVLSNATCDQMDEAIKEGCERVDRNGW